MPPGHTELPPPPPSPEITLKQADVRGCMLQAEKAAWDVVGRTVRKPAGTE